ncbi:hypothetical protein AERO8C_70078 [Aeromonas veronii]|uniref:Uncharacterized protein n=1 Tax=Aeromonas veronii TaxID=654 RepID=A0A653LC55_AERVE|nr:hypothetical protein AERO8C_70078 [Aeromonas veronii]
MIAGCRSGDKHQIDGECHDKAVDGERDKVDAADQCQEGLDRKHRYHEGGDKAHCKHREVGHREEIAALVEIQPTGRHHHGHCHDEGELGGCVTADPHQHATTDGGAGAGEAGPQGETLEQTDAERLLVADVIQGFGCDGRAELLGDDQQDAPRDQRVHDGLWTKQVGLDPAVDGQADHDGGHHAEDDMHQRQGGVIPGRLLAKVDANQAKQAAPEDGDHGEDGAKLDHHFESGSLGPFKAQQMADDNHVAGGGDGEELGQPLDDAQNKGDQQAISVSHRTNNP